MLQVLKCFSLVWTHFECGILTSEVDQGSGNEHVVFDEDTMDSTCSKEHACFRNSVRDWSVQDGLHMSGIRNPSFTGADVTEDLHLGNSNKSLLATECCAIRLDSLNDLMNSLNAPKRSGICQHSQGSSHRYHQGNDIET